MTWTTAPIAVFAYNRPSHLQATLKSLIECNGSDEAPIIIFIDGPKTKSEAELSEQVRLVAADILGSKADIRVSQSNRGLSKSIVGGVGDVIANHGRVIVVEDDLILARCFLQYMNESLNRYAANDLIFQISGHMFNVPEFSGRDKALFLPMTTTWGWATWGRAWSAFDANAMGWEQLRGDRRLRHRFDLNGAYPYSWLMERQQRGRSDSWGIRWYWSVFKRGGVSLFPPASLVSNAGQDGSGTHGGGLVANFKAEADDMQSELPRLPVDVAVSEADFQMVKDAIWHQNGGWKGWAIGNLKKLLRV